MRKKSFYILMFNLSIQGLFFEGLASNLEYDHSSLVNPSLKINQSITQNKEEKNTNATLTNHESETSIEEESLDNVKEDLPGDWGFKLDQRKLYPS